MAKKTIFSKSTLNDRIAVNLTNIAMYEAQKRDSESELMKSHYTTLIRRERRRMNDNTKRLRTYSSTNDIVGESSIEYSLSAKRKEFKKSKITSSRDSAKYIRNFYHEDLMIYESVFILLLDTTNNTIGYAKISQGGVSSTTVDVKIILKYAVDSLASGVILAHNHPTGTLYPSEPDRNITKKLKEALKYIDSALLDHIILTEESYYSFADNNEI